MGEGDLQALTVKSHKLSSFFISSVGTTLLSSRSSLKSVLMEVTT